MSLNNIVTILIPTLTLIIAITNLIAYYFDSKKREEEKKKQVDQLARAFIIDNNNIKDYVPICVIASALNGHKNHHRKLYNEFNKLSDEVQKEVIKQCNYNIDLVKENNWVSKSIKYVNNFLNDNDLGNGRNNYLYDDGKYLHYAIKDYFDREYDDRKNIKKYRNPFPSKKTGFDENNNFVEYLEDFDSYCEEYMYYVIRSTREDFKIFKNKNIAPRPIEYLEMTEDLFNASNEEVSYWVLDFVNYFAIYIINTSKGGYPNKYLNDAKIETYEDKYYETMLNLYLLYKIIIIK